MFVRGIDALMLRTQLTIPDNKFLEANHYNEVFTTHGVIMIIFMAMPFIFGLWNVVIPLQLGARDVAFPVMNNVSFWLFFAGMILFNLSFIVGGSQLLVGLTTHHLLLNSVQVQVLTII